MHQHNAAIVTENGCTAAALFGLQIREYMLRSVKQVDATIRAQDMATVVKGEYLGALMIGFPG